LSGMSSGHVTSKSLTCELLVTVFAFSPAVFVSWAECLRLAALWRSCFSGFSIEKIVRLYQQQFESSFRRETYFFDLEANLAFMFSITLTTVMLSLIPLLANLCLAGLGWYSDEMLAIQRG
jgi:hypothetical protein